MMHNTLKRQRSPWRIPRGGLAAMSMVVCAAVLAAGCATGGHHHAGRADGPSRSGGNPANSEGEVTFPEPNIKTLYAMARILSVQGKQDQSEIVLLRLIAEYPRFVPAYSDLAKMYMETNRSGDARRMLDQGLAIAPADPVLLNNAGIHDLMNENYERALERFTAAAERMPRETQFRGNQALVLALQGRYDESLEIYRQIMPEHLARKNIELVRAANGMSEARTELVPDPVLEKTPETAHSPEPPLAEREATAVSPEITTAPAPLTVRSLIERIREANGPDETSEAPVDTAQSPEQPHAEREAAPPTSESTVAPAVSIESHTIASMAAPAKRHPAGQKSAVEDDAPAPTVTGAVAAERPVPQAPQGFRGMMW